MTSPYSKPPPPTPADLPAGRFGRWLYEFWDYVARNRLQAADNLVPGTGIIIGTSTATFTIAHRTSGVAAGTYGSAGAIPQIVVNNLGHITSVATAASGGGTSTLALAGAVTGTGLVPGTLTGAFAPNPSFSGTATSTGFYAFGQVAAAVGSSSTVGQASVTFLGNITRVGNTSTVFTLMSSTIPANAMQVLGRGFDVRAWGSSGGLNANMGLVYGTSTLASIFTGAATQWELQATVLALSASSQVYRAQANSVAAGVTILAGTTAIGAGSAAPLYVSGTTVGTATGTLAAQEAMLVRFHN